MSIYRSDFWPGTSLIRTRNCGMKGKRCRACRAGFLGDGRLCHDVVKCENGTHRCDANAQCINTLGCLKSTCNSGFSGDGQVCQDVDKCLNGFGDCSSTGTCSNNEGSYTCSCNEGLHGNSRICKCKSGFHGKGFSCFDQDECS